RMLAAVEAEDGGQQLRAEAAALELGADQMDARDEVLEVGVADDEPFEPELVLLALDARPRVARDRLEQLLELVLGPHELARGERLEAHSRGAGGLQAAVDLERDARSREREQALPRRLLQLLAPEEDV